MLRFTQAYLVSMILPGAINGILLHWTLSLWSCQFPTIPRLPEELQWFIFMAMAVVVTLLIGMRTEPLIHWLLTSGLSKSKRDESDDNLKNWRDKLVSVSKGQRSDTDQRVGEWTEKLMSEYYFLNNTYPGLVLVCVISMKYAFGAGDACGMALLPALLSLLLIFYLYPFAMDKWLRDLNSMMRDINR